MREAIIRLRSLGPMPREMDADLTQVTEYEELICGIVPPVTDEEATVLVGVFGLDGCFELAETLIGLVETAPGWPLIDTLEGHSYGVKCLRVRARNSGYEVPQSNQIDDLKFDG